MIRLAVPILILLLTLAGAVWALFGYLELPPLGEPSAIEKPLAAKDSGKNAAPPGAQAKRNDEGAQGGTASFDVARIDPNGTSVFAGRAEPGAQVKIIGDGKPIGTAEADENGEWTFTIERKFASADPKLSLQVTPAAEAKKTAAGTRVAGEEERASQPSSAGEGHSAGTVTAHLLENLKGMVAQARKSQQETTVAAQSAPPATATEPAHGDVTTVNLAPPPKTAPSEPSSKTIPFPITFIFDEANFTEDGRKAAGLLLEYLKLKHFKKVTLTGHADERGTPEFNMELSRQRLDTVAHFLKEDGYTGELELIPKGETEPFMGVVRSQYSQEDLWQLDRRVELVITP
jgi:outer membrane protein OmpA-like peptidoglycan-associated protein